MGMGAFRPFSSSVQTDTTDSEAEGDVEQAAEGKGRFFKFLEKAEELDQKIKDSPQEAKRVSKAEDEEDVKIMFDADEIEISFADQAAERALDADLIDPV